MTSRHPSKSSERRGGARAPQRRTGRPTAAPKRRGGTLGRTLLASALVVVVLGALLGVAGCSMLSASLPDPSQLAARGRDQSTVILDRAGRPLAHLFAEQNRSDRPLSAMPVALQQAVVATEDQRFYTHSGVDPMGIARALWTDFVLRKPSQGGSTITQQYVKNAYGSTDKTLRRKVEEALLANRLEREHTKDQILELYLNTIYFGHGAYGVEAASEAYFGKSVDRLTLPEAAMIAGVIKSPGHYSPYIDTTAAKQRRDVVLAQMQQQGYITTKQYAEAMATPIKTAGLKSPTGQAPYFVEWVKEQLGEKFGQEQLYRGGLTVKTTLDLKVQRAAEAAVAGTLDHQGDPSAALVAIRPGTGEVVAMLGGRDFKTQQFNAAVQGGGRQPGSAFKPFVLATALANNVSPEKTFESGPAQLDVNGQVWDVTGAPNGRTGPIRLRDATEKSVNSVFARLIVSLGAEKVVATAESMGLKKGITPVPAIALGGLTTGVTPMEMADAYATLAANGTHAVPYGITQVTDAKGAVLFSAGPKADQALDPAVAYLTTDILKGVITNGTGHGAGIGRPAAGKTGTTTNNRDAWFVGYTPQLSTAVWVGYPDVAKAMTDVHGRTVTGGSFPAEIWSQFMRAALASQPATDFTRPSGLKQVRICLDTGLAATAYCPRTTKALFLSDMEVGPCTKHAAPTGTRMPDLLGMTRDAALAALTKLHLNASVAEKDLPGVSAGVVGAQTPSAGSTVTSQTPITVTVGTGAAVVPNAPPVLVFDLPATGRVGASVSLVGATTTEDATIKSWHWDFGDGATATGARVSHTWSAAGTYSVTLTATESSGRQTTLSKRIRIR